MGQDLFQISRSTAVKNETLRKSANVLNLEEVGTSFEIWEFRTCHLVEDPEDERFQPDKGQSTLKRCIDKFGLTIH